MIKILNKFKLTVVHFACPNPDGDLCIHVDLLLDKTNCGKSGLGYRASGPPGLRAAGPSRAVGRRPLGLQAAGPLGRGGPWAAGPLGRGGPWAAGRWAAGLLLAKPVRKNFKLKKNLKYL